MNEEVSERCIPATETSVTNEQQNGRNEVGVVQIEINQEEWQVNEVFVDDFWEEKMLLFKERLTGVELSILFLFLKCFSWKKVFLLVFWLIFISNILNSFFYVDFFRNFWFNYWYWIIAINIFKFYDLRIRIG